MKKEYIQGRLNTIITIGVGALLRLFYVVTSSIYDRQYDIGSIDIAAGHTVSGGHLAYIQYIYHNMTLPDVDPTTVYQFHHPPLHHLLCALVMRFIAIFTDNTAVIEESMQVVPFVCSVIALIYISRICITCGLKDKAYTFTMLIAVFHPSLILLSGSVNNDGTAFMFTVMTIYYCIAWTKEYKLKTLILLALSLGLGMSTKQNVAVLAFPIAAVFIYILVRKIKAGDRTGLKSLIRDYCIFGIISIPLGMWFYIRNLVKYNMSILWVYELSTDTWQYTGNVPVINRLLWPVPADMIDNISHLRMGCGYNIWMQLIRTSVLGEWDMSEAPMVVKLVALLLMASGAVLALVALVSFIHRFVCRRADGQYVTNAVRIFMIGLYLAEMIFYIKFAYDYPQECSMNFRYITVTILPPAIALGIDYGRMTRPVLKEALGMLLGLFLLSGCAMTVIWGLMY